MPLLQQLSLRRGDNEAIPIQIYDIDGEPMDASGIEEVFFTVKHKRSNDDEDALIAKTLTDGIEVVESEEGRLQINLDPADTLQFDSAQRGLVWDIQIVLADGSVYTVADGLLNVVLDVTQRISIEEEE